MSPEKASNQSAGSLEPSRPLVPGIASAIRILCPLVHDIDARGLEGEDISEALSEGVERLQEMIARAQQISGLENGDPQINELAQSLAPLALVGDDSFWDELRIDSVLELAKDFSEQLSETTGPQKTLSLQVKGALFSPAVSLCEEMACLGLSDDRCHDEVRTITETAIQLASTLAFQWSKKSGIDDAREELFISTLCAAMTLSRQAWLECFEESLPRRDWRAEHSHEQNYPGLYSAMDALDMAWSQKDGGINEIFDPICDRLNEGIWSRVDRSLPPTLKARLSGALCSAFEERAIEAWEAAADRLQEEVDGMSDDELEAFSLAEGSEPMRLERFDRELSRKSGAEILPGSPELSSEEVLRRARKKLAFLWGISDAASQTRLVTR